MSKLEPIEGWRTFDNELKLICPWYTRNFLELLVTWDVSNWKVFEYGSGDSTVWWRKNAKKVYSIETDKIWADKVGSIYIDNEYDFISYPMKLVDDELFDCIIIDNDMFSRDSCTEYALQSLKENGVLIIDNWDQQSVPPNSWNITKYLLKDFELHIFHQPGHPDWKTLYITKNNISPKHRMITDRKTTGWGYGTHMGALITSVMNTKGPVFEMGCGDFSTVLLHAICKAQGRYLLSTDTSKEWLGLFLDLKSDIHDFIYVPVYEDDWQKNPKPEKWDEIGNQEWGVVFIDHRPGERRRVDIERFSDKAEIIVVHDTEEKGYMYEYVLSKFKYRYDDKRYNVYTTVVSNTIDLSSLF
jgi:hypothetical protein